MRHTIISVLLIFTAMSFHAQKYVEVDADTLLARLPDSCFRELRACGDDSAFFRMPKRFMLLNTEFMLRQKIILSKKEGPRGFFVAIPECRYATVLRCNWWRIAGNKFLVATSLDEVDMCTERQRVVFYEFDKSTGKFTALSPLPAFPISDFVRGIHLRKLKIPSATPAPVRVEWRADDSIKVSIVLAPFQNCPDSYAQDPLAVLKEDHLLRNELVFVRRGKLIVRSAK